MVIYVQDEKAKTNVAKQVRLGAPETKKMPPMPEKIQQ